MESIKDIDMDGVLINCHSGFKLKLLIKFPFHYLVQLFTGSRAQHELFYFLGNAYEAKFSGINITPFTKWQEEQRAEGIKMYAYPLIKKLTPRQILNGKKFIEHVLEAQEQGYYRYCIIPYVLSRIPLLKLIKFKKNRYLFCNSFVIQFYQAMGLIPQSVKPHEYSPDTTIDLMSDYNLIKGRTII